MAGRRFQMWLLLLFAGTALALALLGVYSVIAYGIPPQVALRAE